MVACNRTAIFNFLKLLQMELTIKNSKRQTWKNLMGFVDFKHSENRVNSIIVKSDFSFNYSFYAWLVTRFTEIALLEVSRDQIPLKEIILLECWQNYDLIHFEKHDWRHFVTLFQAGLSRHVFLLFIYLDLLNEFSHFMTHQLLLFKKARGVLNKC